MSWYKREKKMHQVIFYSPHYYYHTCTSTSVKLVFIEQFIITPWVILLPVQTNTLKRNKHNRPPSLFAAGDNNYSRNRRQTSEHTRPTVFWVRATSPMCFINPNKNYITVLNAHRSGRVQVSVNLVHGVHVCLHLSEFAEETKKIWEYSCLLSCSDCNPPCSCWLCVRYMSEKHIFL